jgi:hypothetical protein
VSCIIITMLRPSSPGSGLEQFGLERDAKESPLTRRMREIDATTGLTLFMLQSIV